MSRYLFQADSKITKIVQQGTNLDRIKINTYGQLLNSKKSSRQGRILHVEQISADKTGSDSAVFNEKTAAYMCHLIIQTKDGTAKI